MVPVKKQAAKAQAAGSAAKKPAPGTGTATYPLESGGSSFQDQGITGIQVQPLTPAAPTPAVPAAPAASPTITAPGAALIPPPQLPMTLPAAPAAAAASMPAESGMMPVNVTLEDAAVPPGTSPAVVALVNQADNDRRKGDLDTAVLVMERALRIDPRNPVITYKLAQIRFKQGKFKQAEELAGKAALLAGGNAEVKRKSLHLATEARRIQRLYPNPKDLKAKTRTAEAISH